MKKVIKCKKCGSSEFVVMYKVKGYSPFRFNTTGEDVNNSDMYEGLDFRIPKKAYCNDCGAYFGKTQKLLKE